MVLLLVLKSTLVIVTLDLLEGISNELDTELHSLGLLTAQISALMFTNDALFAGGSDFLFTVTLKSLAFTLVVGDTCLCLGPLTVATDFGDVVFVDGIGITVMPETPVEQGLNDIFFTGEWANGGVGMTAVAWISNEIGDMGGA